MKSPKYEQLILEPISGEVLEELWQNFANDVQSLCEKEILCADLYANPEILEMASIKLAQSMIYDQIRWIFPKFRCTPA